MFMCMLCVCRTTGRIADAVAGANGDPNKDKKKKNMNRVNE